MATVQLIFAPETPAHADMMAWLAANHLNADAVVTNPALTIDLGSRTIACTIVELGPDEKPGDFPTGEHRAQVVPLIVPPPEHIVTAA